MRLNAVRWLRFRLSTSIFVLIGLSFLVNWLGSEVRRVRHMEGLVERISRSGGVVAYDWETTPDGQLYDEDGNLISWYQDQPSPKWVRSIFGDHIFCHVVRADFDLQDERTRLDDITLLRNLPDLRHVFVEWGCVNNKALKTLSDLQQLDTLSLGNTCLKDGQIRYIAPLVNLTTLDLQGNRLSDVAVPHLCNMSGLEWLNLSRNAIRGETLSSLDQLQALRCLYLGFNPIDNAALAKLAPMANLRVLHLEETQIDDEGMRYLGNLKGLEVLNLTGTKVGDPGLKKLNRLKCLKTLDLTSTCATDEGVTYIRRTLPSIQKVIQ